ncbi:hypothetical protein C7974DRAFT_395879 [Boeremia exigua]|uniref:uncharacterized protein n=1 Tax=Boeremia exigua TaxID=749465 RepID=UPI001E8CF931|nr:uncharacterized protein C7974DRAFT_395879 [Boeremia exigua]KAH6625335.1 hypothetical protein C7974DRAFT_395879 [Boeremia exigua]
MTPPGAPSIPGIRVTSPTQAPSTGSTPPRSNTPSATAPAAQAPVVEPAVVPAIPDSLYHFDFWPAQPWDHDPDVSEVPPSENIRKKHDDQGLMQTAIDNFMNSKTLMAGVDESTWTAGKYLASGSYGAAGLWCRVDENNNIVQVSAEASLMKNHSKRVSDFLSQRMVVKDCPQTRTTYSTPREWYDQLPREIALHRRIDRKRKRDETNDKGFTNVVEHFGYRLMMRRRRYRLYLKYYAGSDLGELVTDRFNIWGLARLEDLRTLSLEQLEDMPIVPEALIWYVIMNCASGYLILQHGTTSRTETDPDWRPIMHLDLNISNAFIDPHPDGKSADIVIADLGMGFIERDAPPVPEGYEPLRSDNPYEWTWNERHFCHPPEHQFMWGSPPTKLSEKSDVWRLGSLIWEMITNSRDSDHPMREDATFRDDAGNGFYGKQSVTLESNTRDLDADSMFPTPWRFYPSAERYSPELKQLVRDCLHWYPDSRKTFSELHDIATTEILKHSASFDRDVNAELLPKYDDFAIGKRHKRRR